MSFEYTLKPHAAAAGPTIDYAGLLNAEQYEAVSAEPGPVLVIAGAGSGKTRTLTYRVAYLVEHGVDPEQILLLTFTNKASKEMLRRVGELLPHDISRMWGGTFHHVGHKILRRHARDAGLEPSFTILDREDAKDLMSACLPDAGIDPKEKRFPKSEVIVEIISLAANTGRTLTEVVEQNYDYFSEFTDKIGLVRGLFEQRKRKSNSVDYDDLLTLPVKLLRENEGLRGYYQKRFQHILVDEYQDTNLVQASFVELLAEAHHHVMVVGDDAQSIYSWRGANFENIMKFPDRHPGTRVIRIETNYRSTPEILSLANASIGQNTRQFPKELRPVVASGVKPALVALDDSRQQAEFVAQRMLELREEGMELNDMAVLYRSHFHSMELQMELTRRNIPFQITSGLRFFEQAHIKDVAAFLKLALNPGDEVSFRRIALILPGIGASTAQKLWNGVASGADWLSLKVPAKGAALWKQWAETQKQLREKIDKDRPSNLIQMALDAFYEDYLKAKYPNYTNRIEDIRQLQEFSVAFEECAEFLAQLSLMTNMDAEPAAAAVGDGEAIKLSSIHQAKGLEWKVVFVIMLCDGMFPSSRSVESSDGEEEERRLFYVAVTRAREELYLTHPQIRSGGNYGDTWQKPSRFLTEFPRSLCNVWTIRRENAWEHGDVDQPF
jgi:DNA helicase II / ATP-dependent DNA helicase PcrA